MSTLRRLIHEIHRRSLWQVLGIYVVGSWVVLQAVDTLAGALNLPDWATPLAFFLLIVGLPVVLATAFVQEGIGSGPTPGTAARDESGTPASPALDGARTLLTWRNAISGGVLAFAVWGVVATAVLLAGSRSTSGGSEAGAGAVLRSIAVLPFENLSPDAENAYFADGIHEDVLTQLSKVGDLTVISRTSVLPYRDSGLSLSQIARELGVGTILEGSVRRAGDNVRITAQLIDARTDEHLWADNFDRALTTANVFAIQTEIAQSIARALAATLSTDEAERIARSPTTDLAAYDFYLQARNTYQLYTEAGNDEAIRLYKEALRRDPEYADAWAGLADAYSQRVQRFGFGREWSDSAVVTAQRALELDPDLPQAHKAIALAYDGQGRVQASLDANLKAIELDPSYSEALNNVAAPLASQGRYDEALRYMKRSYRIEPTTGFTRSNIALAYALLGMADRAEALADELLRLQPGSEEAVAVLRLVDEYRGEYGKALERARALAEERPEIARRQLAMGGAAFQAGDFETTLTAVRESLRLAPESDASDGHHTYVLLGISLLKTGAEAEGRRILEEWRAEFLRRAQEFPENAQYPLELAAIDATFGDTASALDWIDRAYDQGFRSVIGIADDPAYAALHGLPRWESFLTRMQDDIATQRANVQREEAEAGAS